jgi:hypothetical protein
VHTDEPGAALADGLGAKAFAFGNDVFFAHGRYQPGATEGRKLLAHELTHVAQQQRGPASDGAVGAEPQARAVAEDVSQNRQPGQDAIGGAEQGVYCDDEEKKPADPQPSPDPEINLNWRPRSSSFTFGGGLQLDWLALQRIYGAHGFPMSERDAAGIQQEWQRNSQLLDTFGITDRFKLGFITKEWILNKGLQKQVEAQQARDNPNTFDMFNREFKQQYPGGFETPIIPIFDLDWFRSKKKK